MSDRSYVEFTIPDQPGVMELLAKGDELYYGHELYRPGEIGDEFTVSWDEIAWGFDPEGDNEAAELAKALRDNGFAYQVADGGYSTGWPEREWAWCPQCPGPAGHSRMLDGCGEVALEHHLWRTLRERIESWRTGDEIAWGLVEALDGHFGDDHHRWLSEPA